MNTKLNYFFILTMLAALLVGNFGSALAAQGFGLSSTTMPPTTLTISPSTIPNGTYGMAYSQQFTASGGDGSYIFSQTGTLPAGMSFSGDTLSGTPTQAGSFPITIMVADGMGGTGSQDYILVVMIAVNSFVQRGTGTESLCTLGAAIEAANTDTAVDGCPAGSEADTIYLPAGTYELTLPVYENSYWGDVGLPEIYTDITIAGAVDALGVPVSIIQRPDFLGDDEEQPTPEFRLLSIGRLGTDFGNLTLKNLRLVGGKVTTASASMYADGGAVYAGLSTALTADNVIFYKNQALIGGAICAARVNPTIPDLVPATISLSNSTFSENTAPEGGGAIQTPGGLTMVGTDFLNNTATSGYGGAIYAGDENLSITESFFGGNRALYHGGAIYAYNTSNSSITIASTEFKDNFVTDTETGGSGGAIYSASAALSITDSTFSQNSAVAHAGAIISYGNLSVAGSTFTYNSATGTEGKAGAIEVAGSGTTLTIMNSTFDTNTASDSAGAIQIWVDTATVSGSTFMNNSAQGFNGGAIDIYWGSTTTITNSTFTGNNAYFGKGGGIANQGQLTLTNVTLTGNDAAQGGNLASTDNTATLYNTILVRPTYGGNCYNLNFTIENGGGNLQYGDSSCGSIQAGDPKLQNLADNGGATLTMALGAGSAALEIGVAVKCPATDQRGVTRPQPASTNCDAGSYESDSRLALETTITTHPANPSNSTAASFQFTSSETGSTFECQLDSGGYSTCISPQAYTSLDDGSHTFFVKATDSAGNTDPTPASYTWTIDTIAPQTFLTANPPNPSFSSSATFAFISNEGTASFACKLDGELVFSECISAKTYTDLLDGSHTFGVKAIDAAGNADATPVSYTWTVEAAPPSTTITSKPSNPSNSNAATFNFTSDDPLVLFTCRLDGVEDSCVSGVTYSSLADGLHYFEVWARDAYQKVGTPDSWSWTIDTVVPNTVIDTGPVHASNSSNATFTFHSTDSISSGGQSGDRINSIESIVMDYECQLDSGGYSDCTSPKYYTSLSDGSHSFQVRARDAAGNIDPTPASYDWTIDTLPPETTIDDKPSDPDNDASPSFYFSSPDGVGFSCQLDSLGWSVCTSPQDYTGLADGSHTFEVRSTDLAGNTDASPASYTWTIDATPPQTTITGKPNDPSNSYDASFSFTSSEAGSTFLCQYDDEPFGVSCTSPTTIYDLGNGSHTVWIWATDAAGNPDATPATFTWTIDTVPPNTTIISHPAYWSNNTTASFTFSSTETRSNFMCKLDGSAYSSCSSPKVYTSLSNGSHIFYVRATDYAGNPDLDPASYNWIIDTVAPDTTIDSKPSDPSNNLNPSFSFSSTSDASFECQLDGSEYGECTSPQNYAGLVDGSHTFQVRAIDQAGNTDPSPASWTWEIDTVAPDTTIDTYPNNPSNSANAAFTFSSSAADAPFECQMDGAGFISCTSPQNYTGLSDGSHTFQVRSTDLAGNTDASPASYTWTIDTLAPDTSITAQPSNPSNSSAASFSFSSEAGATFQCQLDAGTFSACTSPQAYTSLLDGSHTFTVKATNSAGNTDPTPASYTWTIDTAAPDTTINTGPSDPSNSPNATFTFSSADAGASFECQMDGGGFAGCSSPKDYTGLSDSLHTFHVRAIDPAGNVDSTPASHSWTIDTLAPDTSISAQPSNPSNSAAASFSFSALFAVSFECKLDAGTFSACTSPQNYTALADGSHTFQVRATDEAGNTDPTPASYTWTIDTSVPGMWVSNLSLSSKAGRTYTLTGLVTISSEAGAVQKAAVTIQWSKKNEAGNFIPIEPTSAPISSTNRSGIAKFTLRSQTAGTYELCVTNVVKSGWEYSETQNTESCQTITVPITTSTGILPTWLYFRQ